HTVRLAIIITGYQIRIYLCYLLRHEAELRDPLGVKLLLVTEGHRFKRQNRFARLVHWFNFVLKASGRKDGAELTVGSNNDSYPCGHSHPTDAGDECSPLRSGRADADLRVFIGANAFIADVDVVTACNEVSACI